MSKNSQFGDGVPEVKTQCFRGFQPRVHELWEGGDAHAYYFAYRTFYRHDHRKKQQPPLCQVTVVSLI